MRRFAADVMGVIATHRGRARFAKPAKGLFLGAICVDNGRLCMGGGVMFLVEILTL